MFRWTLNNEFQKYKEEMKIVTEAPAEDTATDYSAAAKELDNAPSAAEASKIDAQNPEMNDDATDYTQEADTGDTEDTDNENPEATDEETTDETGDDMEATDYDEGSPDAEGEGEADPEADTGEDDIQNEETPTDDGDKAKNTYLVRDFIELYYTTRNMIEKLNNVTKTTLVKSKVYLQVIENLTDMNNVLYEYITHDFSKKSYVFNLYQFNLFLECIKVNIEIIKKSGELQSND